MEKKSMSSHNSIADVPIYRQWLFLFFHSSYSSSCSGEVVLLPKVLFSSVRVLVLSACNAVGVWYHEECRSKFGLKGSEAIMCQWQDCGFVKSQPDPFNQLTCQLHNGDIWLIKSVCPWTKAPYNNIYTHMCTHTHTHTHSHTNTHSHIPTQTLWTNC